jgi:hypothetical protein
VARRRDPERPRRPLGPPADRAGPSAVQPLDAQRATIYTDIVAVSLRATARAILEDLMANGTYQYQSDFAKRYFGQGKAEGEAKGKAEAIIAILETRGVEVTESARARILGCTDLTKLDAWLTRAVMAKSAREVIAE